MSPLNPLQRRKQLTEALYARVKQASPALYEQATFVASMFADKLGNHDAAALERHCMSLVESALSECVSNGAPATERPFLTCHNSIEDKK